MRYCILPTTIDSTDEKGNAVKISIYISPSRMSVDGTQFVMHEELMPLELKKYVLKAVDLEGTITEKSAISAGKVLATKARAWMDGVEWKAGESVKGEVVIDGT